MKVLGREKVEQCFSPMILLNRDIQVSSSTSAGSMAHGIAVVVGNVGHWVDAVEGLVSIHERPEHTWVQG